MKKPVSLLLISAMLLLLCSCAVPWKRTYSNSNDKESIDIDFTSMESEWGNSYYNYHYLQYSLVEFSGKIYHNYSSNSTLMVYDPLTGENTATRFTHAFCLNLVDHYLFFINGKTKEICCLDLETNNYTRSISEYPNCLQSSIESSKSKYLFETRDLLAGKHGIIFIYEIIGIPLFDTPSFTYFIHIGYDGKLITLKELPQEKGTYWTLLPISENQAAVYYFSAPVIVDNQSILVYDLTANEFSEHDLGFTLGNLKTDGKGFLYCHENNEKKLLRYDINTREVTAYSLPLGKKPRCRFFLTPTGIIYSETEFADPASLKSRIYFAPYETMVFEEMFSGFSIISMSLASSGDMFIYLSQNPNYSFDPNEKKRCEDIILSPDFTVKQILR